MAHTADGNGSAGRHFGGGSSPKPTPRFSTNRASKAPSIPRGNASASVPTASEPVVAPHATTQATARYRMSVPNPGAQDARQGAAQQGVAPATQATSSDDAPRAVESTANFSTISGSQGAVISNRDNAEEAASAARSSMRGRGRTRQRSGRLSAAAGRNVSRHDVALENSGRSRKVFIGLAIAAAVVIVLVAILVSRAWNSTSDEVEPSTRVERTETTADGSVSYDGYTYATKKFDSGKYGFVRTSEDGSGDLTLFELSGEPVAVVLCDGAYCIPENLSDGTWDVMVYTMGDGSVASQLVDSDGNAITGTGTLTAAKLDGTDLVLTDDSGNETRASLQ